MGSLNRFYENSQARQFHGLKTGARGSQVPAYDIGVSRVGDSAYFDCQIFGVNVKGVDIRPRDCRSADPGLNVISADPPDMVFRETARPVNRESSRMRRLECRVLDCSVGPLYPAIVEDITAEPLPRRGIEKHALNYLRKNVLR